MDIPPENWNRVLDVNLGGVFYLSQAFVPHMRERKQGSIVCMSSVSASAAAASSAARTIRPPRPACSASPRRWRGNSDPTASVSTASRPA